jgi:hypothetical protein
MTELRKRKNGAWRRRGRRRRRRRNAMYVNSGAV